MEPTEGLGGGSGPTLVRQDADVEYSYSSSSTTSPTFREPWPLPIRLDPPGRHFQITRLTLDRLSFQNLEIPPPRFRRSWPKILDFNSVGFRLALDWLDLAPMKVKISDSVISLPSSDPAHVRFKADERSDR